MTQVQGLRHESDAAAGMTERVRPADMAWGDRMSIVSDRYGQEWSLAAPIPK